MSEEQQQQQQRISTNSFFSESSVDDSSEIQQQQQPPTPNTSVLMQEDDLQSEEADVICIAADNGCGVEVKRSSITAASIGSGINNDGYEQQNEHEPPHEEWKKEQPEEEEEPQHIMPEVEQQQVTIAFGNNEVQQNDDEVDVSEGNGQQQQESRPVCENIQTSTDVPEVQPQPRQSLVSNLSDDVVPNTLANRPVSLASKNVADGASGKRQGEQVIHQKSVESPSSEEKIMAQMRAKQNVSNLIAKFNTVSVSRAEMTNEQQRRNGCAKQKECHEVGASKISELRQKFSQK